MEDNPASLGVEISVVPNLHMGIPSTAKDEHAPLEQFEEVPAGYLDEAMA